jgi:hypothetical protein
MRTPSLLPAILALCLAGASCGTAPTRAPAAQLKDGGLVADLPACNGRTCEPGFECVFLAQEDGERAVCLLAPACDQIQCPEGRSCIAQTSLPAHLGCGSLPP